MRLHLVSDSTGETVSHIAKAVIVQFKELDVEEVIWPLIRSASQIKELIEGIRKKPGFVLYTVVDQQVRTELEIGCRDLGVPCVSVMQPVINSMKAYLGLESDARPGRQHSLDDDYFDRIGAMDYVLSHDDGQSDRDLESADVILLGVSRTSKTPTCIYLGNRGIRAANFPIVPGSRLPDALFAVQNTLVVGLTKDPRQLVQIRRHRLQMLNQETDTDYVDTDLVTKEINEARRLFDREGWPVINVSRRSIEETAATIIQLLKRHNSIGDEDPA